jgi:hypothetical protein
LGRTQGARRGRTRSLPTDAQHRQRASIDVPRGHAAAAEAPHLSFEPELEGGGNDDDDDDDGG